MPPRSAGAFCCLRCTAGSFSFKNSTGNCPLEKHSNRNSIIFVSILAAFLPPFMASSVTVALPTIGREFSMPPVYLTWIVTSYFLAIAAFLIPFGKAGDLYGRRNIFLYGVLLYTASCLLAGCASGAMALIAARVLQLPLLCNLPAKATSVPRGGPRRMPRR